MYSIALQQWFPTWGPRKAVGGPQLQDVLRSMGGGPQNAYRGPRLKKVGNRCPTATIAVTNLYPPIQTGVFV